MGISTGVLGASGYAGGELLRLLLDHPAFDLELAAADSLAGTPITDTHPGLAPLADVSFPAVDIDKMGELDLVFAALPHGASAALTSLLPDSVKVVDVGADHRLRDSAQWDKYYGVGQMAQPWTYGLPELPGRRELIADSSLVASAGCHATAVELSLAPLLAQQVVSGTDIVTVSASGTSGAGRKAATHLLASEVMGSMSAYRVGGSHQHTAEIEQELTAIGGVPVTISFTPLLAPMSRGILATTTARVADGVSASEVREALVASYGDEPFVHVLPAGRQPLTSATYGSNAALIQVDVDENSGRAVIVCAIDNLGKGAAGQSIQNANLMFGLEEAAGLSSIGIAP